MRIASVGHAVFAATMIAMGLMGLIQGDFAPIWQQVPEALSTSKPLAYLCAFVSLAGGLGLLWRRTAAPAARVLFFFLFAWMLLVDGRFVVQAPLVEGSYQMTGETAVIVAAAWVLYAGFATDGDRRRVGFAVGDRGVRLARVLYGLALVAFGLSHFVYLELTTPLVPAWLHVPVFWAYFTGATFLAAGLAVIFRLRARLAAALSAWQIGLFTLIVWGPILAVGNVSAQHWTETVVSWVLTAAAWVVADSYRESGQGPSFPPAPRVS
ncbi:MAG TPA: DoxX family protein [Thermoanaerobaculia bacterium]|nr:DoxX family protein [Thermoanaerobaculia bacterium]